MDNNSSRNCVFTKFSNSFYSIFKGDCLIHCCSIIDLFPDYIKNKMDKFS